MSLLAEPRRRRKAWQSVLAPDPQNLKWRTSSNNIGMKMMEKMGWSDGKGIGKNEQGIFNNVSLKPNYTAKGLGCALNQHDKVLVAHQDDYADILKMLNKKKSGKDASSSSSSSSDSDSDNDVKPNVQPKPKRSIQEISKSSRRIFYRYTKGKDLSTCSDYDRSGIFGRKADKTINEEKEANALAEEEKVEDNNAEGTTVVSKMTMADYFAKAAGRKRKPTVEHCANNQAGMMIKQEIVDVEEKREKRKFKQEEEEY